MRREMKPKLQDADDGRIADLGKGERSPRRVNGKEWFINNVQGDLSVVRTTGRPSPLFALSFAMPHAVDNDQRT